MIDLGQYDSVVEMGRRDAKAVYDKCFADFRKRLQDLLEDDAFWEEFHNAKK